VTDSHYPKSINHPPSCGALFMTADFELGLNLQAEFMTSSFTYIAYARIIRKDLEKFEDLRSMRRSNVSANHLDSSRIDDANIPKFSKH
jgi:hypothetical protein